jgi:DNA-directed RNA polymerase specialized sigma24 family protein
MDDHEILLLLQQRLQHAIPALAQRFGPHLYRTALNLLGSPQDAEECVNDTYMAVWNSVPPNHPEPLQPYIYRIGRNIALNRLRSNSAQKRSGYELSLDELENYLKDHTVDVVVLTIPQSVAQETADRLIGLGIRGFWNFTNVELSSSDPDVKFENIHFADSLLKLSYHIANR